MAQGTIVLRDATGTDGRDGSTEVELSIEDRRVSECRIVPLSLRIGLATVRMDGIGLVETVEEDRGRGLARRVMESAIKRMEQRDAALSMLYGITNFYPKFGYVTAGPESTVFLPPLNEEVRLPDGWCTRPFEGADLPAVQLLYEQAVANTVGAAVRPEAGYPWTVLLDSIRGERSSDCTVIVQPNKAVVGYAWRGERLQFVQAHSGLNPDALILAEAAAASGTAADVTVQVCRRWGAEVATRRGRTVDRVILFVPPEGSVVDAARYVPSTFQQEYGPDGGWMARVVNTERLFRALEPELSRRLQDAHISFEGRARIQTEGGSATLNCGAGVRVVGEQETCSVLLPQTVLVRLVLGAYQPEDVLRRLETPVGDEIARLLAALFPKRQPQLYLADRF